MFAFKKYIYIFTVMPLLGSNIFDTTMFVFFVVPMSKFRYPSSSIV
ncbi:hypothetical protein VHA_000083 [Grimontia hollisae CIP 101886]|uniref:Uncharacterized protein n=1 Tax=Grimontia hollisae CIP 101886 TaxID=675812 RepID=D0I2X0_GRIHO|nr:hypothetical protein VHA_000083 [Grimontia hollisae CIP 101886]